MISFSSTDLLVYPLEEPSSSPQCRLLRTRSTFMVYPEASSGPFWSASSSTFLALQLLDGSPVVPLTGSGFGPPAPLQVTPTERVRFFLHWQYFHAGLRCGPRDNVLRG